MARRVLAEALVVLVSASACLTSCQRCALCHPVHCFKRMPVASAGQEWLELASTSMQLVVQKRVALSLSCA
jgi:hypothetical protein